MDFGETPRRLLDLPSYAITAIAARAAQLAAERVAVLGVPKAAYGVLAVLDERGSSSQAELGRRLGMDRRSVSETAVSLEEGSWVTRRPDPSDPRRNSLDITADGRRLLARLEASFVTMQDELLGALPTEDRAELHRLLLLLAAGSGPGDGQA